MIPTTFSRFIIPKPWEDNLPTIPDIKTSPDFTNGNLIKDRYKVIEHLHGAMVDVYHCVDMMHHTDVALKTVISYGKTNHKKMISFKKEIDRILFLPTHPNVATLQRIENIDGYYYLVTEWVEGEHGNTLADWLKSDALATAQAPAASATTNAPTASAAPFTTANALNFIQQIACGLAHCHKYLGSPDSPYCFGDIKPENILITKDDILKLGDFSGGYTKGWCAPELLDGKGDERSDIYGMAKVGIKLLGCAADIGSELYHQLWDILSICLEKEPDDRYQTLVSVLQDLNNLSRTNELSPYDETQHSAAPFLDKYNRTASALTLGIASRFYDPLNDNARLTAMFSGGTVLTMSDYMELTNPREKKLYRAKSFFYSGKIPEALTEMDGRLDTAELLYFRAYVLYRAGNVDEAVHCLIASALLEDYLPAFDLLATILLDQPGLRVNYRREADSINARCIEACKRHPSGYLPFQAVAKHYMLSGDYPMASSCFRKSLQFVNIESDWQVLYYYGCCEGAMGDSAKSSEIMSRAIDLIRSDPDYLKNAYKACILFFCLNSLHKLEEARDLAIYLKDEYSIDYTNQLS